MGSDCAVGGLAVVAIVQGRDVGCDQLAFCLGKRTGLMEEHICEFTQGFGGFWAEMEKGSNAREVVLQRDVRHNLLRCECTRFLTLSKDGTLSPTKDGAGLGRGLGANQRQEVVLWDDGGA